MKTLTALLVATLAGLASAQTADDIMAKVEAQPSPKSQTSNMTMVLLDSRGNQRVRAMTSQFAEIEGVDQSLLFFLEPGDVRGTGFLMLDYPSADQEDDQWMFLPSLNKAKRIASGDKTGSFMGSDFSYADMSQRNLEEWDYQLLKTDEVNGQPVWIIEALPVNAEVTEKTGYTRSILYVRQDNYQITRGINYLQKKGEVKLMNVGAMEQIGDYWIATETQMVTQKQGKTVHRTLMKVSDIAVDVDVDASQFTLQRLEQGL